MARVAPVRAGERILDVGCGLDTCLDFVREPVHGVTCDTLVARLQEFGLSPGLRHTAGALEALPFREGAFDRVFLMNVLDHVYDAPCGLRELARVLVPTGALVLSVDVYEGRRYVTKRLHKWFARLRGARTKHPLVFSEQSVARRLRAAGFALVHVAHVAGTKSRRRLFVARRL
jgi:SAM-dependent methyltransferase